MKLFCVSDIHSYFSIFINALAKAGYNSNNKEHLLILCGDCFDRGDESEAMYDFLISNQDKIKYIRGNHEDLILECIERGFFERHDMSNGTVKTIMDLGGQGNCYSGNKYIQGDIEVYNKAANIAYAKLKPLIDTTLNYYETQHYIFTHSWIPSIPIVTQEDLMRIGEMAYNNPSYQYDPDWRTAYSYEWDDMRWANPFRMAKSGLNQTGKTIVSGHWHTSWPRALYEGKDAEDKNNFGIYYNQENKHIGIDACTAYTEQVNVLVIEDELLEE